MRRLARGLPTLAWVALGCVQDAPAADDASLLQAMVDSVLPRIERVSGMRPLAPVRIERRSESDIRAYVESQLETELPPDVIDAIRRTYALLGLMPDTLDLRSLLLDLYTEQIIGYYDPDAEVLYVAEAVDANALLPVVTHELVHALQDQRADLDSLIAPARGNDRQSAAQAALEGQATLVMFAILAGNASGQPADPLTLPNPAAQLRPALQSPEGQFPVFRRAPRILQEMLLFPYIGGSSFVQELWRAHGGAGDRPVPLDSLLPQSTEQILHPGRAFLDERDRPTELRFEAGGAVHEDTFGELEMQLLFEQHLGRSDPAPSSGWDGDRFRLIEIDGEDALVWATVWDSDGAADRFAEAIRAVGERLGRSSRIDRSTIEGRPAVNVLMGESAADPPAIEIPRVCIVADPAVASCEVADR